MEEPIQPNVNRILNIFNSQMANTFDKLKQSMQNELYGQVNKNSFMCKLNRASDKPLYSNKGITLNSIYDFMKVKDSKIRYYDVNFEHNEYIINYKYQSTDIHQHQSHKMYNFLLIITNYGTIIVHVWSSYFAQNNGYSESDILKFIYCGKFKLNIDILYFLNEMINTFLSFAEYNNDKRESEHHTNMALTFAKSKQFGPQFRFCKKYQFLIYLIKTYQENHTIPLIQYNAQKILDEKDKLNRDRVELEKVNQELKRTDVELKQQEEDIRKKLEKYEAIKNLEEKFRQIQKYKEQLDRYARQLENDKKRLDIEIQEFESSIGNESDLPDDLQEELQEDEQCVICFNKKDINLVLVPCGHRVYCESCIRGVSECSVCRASVTSVMKLY